ncbi:GNAT family N-acetyltransferase [soil metagenome]
MTTRDAETADGWNRPLETPRLLLAPLDHHDADELVHVLADGELYRFTGGSPPAVAELRRRFGRWATRLAPDGRQLWLNWVIRIDGRALGTLHATVSEEKGRPTAEVAWIIGVRDQGQGYASEAGRALLAHLLGAGVEVVRAHIHPDHLASARVASATGLRPTDEWIGGERRWEIRREAPPGPGDGAR